MTKSAIIIPNWNGKNSLKRCLDSVLNQSTIASIILIENGSNDGSLEYVKKEYSSIKIIDNKKNLGFSGGVNAGIKYALDNNYTYIALLNNDAVADKKWLENMLRSIKLDKKIGIVTPKMLSNRNNELDSTGDYLTRWGLPYPRGRGVVDQKQYDRSINVFSASGGASLYRAEMFNKVGLFDEDFFAYYEDMDLSFRAQLAGWKIIYEPTSIVHHQIGATSNKIKGFTTYQTMKNLPWLILKNIPLRYLIGVMIRFSIAYLSFALSSIRRGQFTFALKGILISSIYIPKKLIQRYKIQKNKNVSDKYIWSMIVKDLPPNAKNLRKFRKILSLGLIQ
jgi:GT2 family glycosyltransferase